MGGSPYRFPLIIACIGFIYGLVIVAFKTAFGKGTEGAAAIALTALLTALFQKYQKAAPRALRSDPAINSGSPLGIIVLMFGFLGMQFFAGICVALLRLKFPNIPPLNEYLGNFPTVLAMLTASYFAAGSLVTLAMPTVRASTLMWAALLAYISNLVLEVIPWVMTKNWFELTSRLRASAPMQVFCLVYLVAAVAPQVIKKALSPGRV